MKELRDLLGRAALLASARIVSKLATLVVVLTVARRLPLDDFGLLSTLLAYSTLAGLAADFGLLMPTLRGMSQSPGDEALIFGRTVWTRITGALMGSMLLFAGGVGMGYPLTVLWLFLATAVTESLFTAVVRSHEARQAIGTVTAFVIVERASYALWVLTAVWWKPTLGMIGAASLGSMLLMSIAAILFFRRRFGWTVPPFGLRLLREGSKIGLPLFVVAVLSAAYYRLDIVLLERLSSPAEAGVYSAAMRVVEALMFIPMSMMATLFPILASSHARDSNQFRVTVRRASLLFALVGGAVSLAIVTGAHWVVGTLYPDVFSRSGGLLSVLGPMLFFYFLNFLGSQTLMAMHHDRALSVIVGGAAIVATILNVVLIPQFGAFSSAWVRVGMETAMSVAFAVWIVGELRRPTGEPDRPEAGPSPTL